MGKIAADETTRTLFLRGREMEAARDPGGALDLYARALALPEADRDPADTAAILHHVGDYSALLGDESSAWNAYLSAARLFHERGEGPNISASLGKAGLLLVEFRSPVPIREAITHALLLTGFAGVLDHAVETFLGVDLPTMGTALVMHRKLTGLMILASGAAADVILEKGALALYHRVVLPFSERPDVRQRAEMDEPRFAAAAFDALARIYEAVGEQEKPHRVSVPPTPDEVRSLTHLTTIAFSGAPQKLMSQWLGTYLRDRRGAAWATDEVLAGMRLAT